MEELLFSAIKLAQVAYHSQVPEQPTQDHTGLFLIMISVVITYILCEHL
jgi:hypothetical protein